MRSRIKRITNWLKKIGPIWKSLEVFDTALGLWERLPTPIRWAIRWLSGWVISTVLAYVAVVTGWVDEFGPPILIAVVGGLVIGTVLSAIIYVIGNRLALAISQRTVPEGYRLVPRDAQVHYGRALRGEQPAATGTVTVSEPVYVPEDHDKPSDRIEGKRQLLSRLNALALEGQQIAGELVFTKDSLVPQDFNYPPQLDSLPPLPKKIMDWAGDVAQLVHNETPWGSYLLDPFVEIPRELKAKKVASQEEWRTVWQLFLRTSSQRLQEIIKRVHETSFS